MMNQKITNFRRLERTQEINRPLQDVFEFFSDAANLQQLTPGFLKFRILSPTPIEMRTGVRIDYALSLFGLPIKWRTQITAWEPGVRFVDEQERGPYALWRHTHEFEAQGEHTIMRDVVEYKEPLGWLGHVAHYLFVKRTLNKIFDYRRDQVAAAMSLTQSSPETTVQEVQP